MNTYIRIGTKADIEQRIKSARNAGATIERDKDAETVVARMGVKEAFLAMHKGDGVWVIIYSKEFYPDPSELPEPKGEGGDPFFGEVIHTYTRRQALADGVQIEVTPMAQEAGIKFPVFLTRTVWKKYVLIPDGVQDQDTAGRLWDILTMFRFAASKTTSASMIFQLHVRNDNRHGTPPLVTLRAECGAKDIDDPQPAITVMMPDED